MNMDVESIWQNHNEHCDTFIVFIQISYIRPNTHMIFIIIINNCYYNLYARGITKNHLNSIKIIKQYMIMITVHDYYGNTHDLELFILREIWT